MNAQHDCSNAAAAIQANRIVYRYFTNSSAAARNPASCRADRASR